MESGQPAVLDLSELSGNETSQFMTAFAERLYQLKAKSRSPLHLIIDEADAYAPQKPLPEEQRMLGAVDKIVRRGRARGLGVTLVTQRPAVISKNVLTQIEVLIALRTVAPQDRKAIESWVEVHGTQEQRDTLASLPSLPVGTAWVWSPGWLNVFQQVQIRQRRTFDSSATPKVGMISVNPSTLAAVDLTELQRQISATTEGKGTERNNGHVRYLKQRVAELEEQLQVRVEVPIFQNGEVERLETAAKMQELGSQMIEMAEAMQGLLQGVVQQTPVEPEPLQAWLHSGEGEETTQLAIASDAAAAIPHQSRKSVQTRSQGSLDQVSTRVQLRAGEQRMLQTLARHYPMKLTRTQLGTLSHFAAVARLATISRR